MSENQVNQSAQNQDNENGAQGQFHDNTIYTFEKYAISVGKTRSGRHTLTYGYIHDDGNFSTRVPTYVDVSNDSIDGVKGMSCPTPQLEAYRKILTTIHPEIRDEVREFLSNRKPSEDNRNDRKVEVIRSPGKTERERAKLNAKKEAAKGQEDSSKKDAKKK